MKLNINSARKGNSSYTFSPMSLVTLDFGRLQPIKTFSMVLGDKFDSVQANGLLRCTPQVFPPFGRMNIKNAAFFVPDSQIYSWSSAFHSDNNLWRGQIADKTPQVGNYFLNTVFEGNLITGLATTVATHPATAPARNTYDFTFPSGPGRASGQTNLNYFRLTPYGWKVYALFKALGYDFVTFPTDSTNAYGTQSQHLLANNSDISLVPFLAYCKIWNDFFCNSYQADKNPISDYLQKIYLNKDIIISGNTEYNSSTFTATPNLIVDMIQRIHVPFESNMYTNAWNNPNDPTGLENNSLNQVYQQSLISPYGSSNFGEFGSISANSANNEHGANLQSGSATYFSELGHKTLEAFDRFVRRRNLLGSKAVQQLYGLFGIEPDEFKKDYVVKLCEGSSRVNFSAITSQSDTQTATGGKPLGAFAGTGLGGFNMNFSYEANTFGTVICLTWLNIDPIIMHGFSPDVLRVKPFDFFNPDWDGKAYRPIPMCEITGAKSIDVDGATAIKTYGYTNMYDDYRMMRDTVAGNFLDDTTKHFAFMRDLTESENTVELAGSHLYPQSNITQYWEFDGSSDLTNPFLTLASAGDRFWFAVDWNIKCTRPMLSNENSFDLDGEGSLTIKKNGDGIA